MSVLAQLGTWCSNLFAAVFPARDMRRAANKKTKTEIYVTKEGAAVLQRQLLSKPIASVQIQPLNVVLKQLKKRTRVILTLNADLFIERQTSLPASAINRAANILELDLPRVTPLKRKEVISSWFPRGNAGSNKVAITQLIAKKALVSEIIERISNESHSRVVAVAFRPKAGGAFPGLTQPDGRPFGYGHEQAWRRVALAAPLVGVISVSLAGYLMVSKQHAEMGQIQLGIKELQEKAAVVRQQLEVQKEQSTKLTYVQALRSNRVKPTAIWAELTKALPDTASLQGLAIRGGTLQIEGQAKDAEQLINLLESSDLIQKVRFSSPVIKNPGEAIARFSIAVDVVSDAAK